MADYKESLAMGAAGIIALIFAFIAVCTGATAPRQRQQVLHGSDGLQLRVLTATQISVDKDVWVYLVKRVHPEKSQPKNKIVDKDSKIRHQVRQYERELDQLVPKVVSKTNKIVYDTETKINRQYDDAEKQLDKTVQDAAGKTPSKSVHKLVNETIPQAITVVNNAVNDAQVNINNKIWKNEVLLNNEVAAAEAQLDKTIRKNQPIDAKQITKIIDLSQANVKKQLLDDGKIISGYIDFGNQVVADNIVLVETAVKREFPKGVSDKVTSDIKRSSIEIDDSIKQGSDSVRAEVNAGISQWQKLVPTWPKKN